MSRRTSYADSCSVRIELEHLLLNLDFAMWLEIEHNGQSPETPISLAKEPREGHDAAVEAYLAEHRRELLQGHLECPKCGATYVRRAGLRKCSTDKGMQICGTPLRDVPDEKTPDSWLREQAGFALARKGDVAAIRWTVCTGLVRGLYPGAVTPDDVVLPLNEALEHLQTIVESQVDRLAFRLSRFETLLPLGGRRNLLPQGTTLREKHEDYLASRDKLITGQVQAFAGHLFCHNMAKCRRSRATYFVTT